MRSIKLSRYIKPRSGLASLITKLHKAVNSGSRDLEVVSGGCPGSALSCTGVVSTTVSPTCQISYHALHVDPSLSKTFQLGSSTGKYFMTAEWLGT